MNFNSKQIPLAPSPTRCQLVVSVAIVFFLSISICFVFSLSQGLPYPLIHDEYSYCLAGETFASGRLTNATHPMAEHFETMHVLQYPTNMSKYPPGQGIVLAIRHWIGHPIFGVWLSWFQFCGALLGWDLSTFRPGRFSNLSLGFYWRLVVLGSQPSSATKNLIRAVLEWRA